MIKAYINIFVLLLLSWSVYGYCQQDQVLPMIAGGIVLSSLLFRLHSAEKHFVVFAQIPLSVVIILSFVAGMFWRNFFPIPEAAQSPFPEFTAALQSGSIFASILIWLRPFTKVNLTRLVFCAWLTVPLSMNVPFHGNMLIVFSSFCFMGIALVILFTQQRPAAIWHLFTYARDFIVYSILIIMLTTLLFLGISTTIVSMERAFFNTMSDYILPRNYTHFLRISSQLNLITPGTSAFDRRPVMEVSLPKDVIPYLKIQVFEHYKNGTWTEPKAESKVLLPGTLPAGQNKGRMMMFTDFKDIVPAPEDVTAVKARVPYWQSVDQILYTQDQQKMRVIEFSLAPHKQAVVLSEEQRKFYTALPSGIASELKDISDGIVDQKDDVKTKANKISQYFRNQFTYSLEVSFSADDKGLIKMIKEKKPAYCTYFASALALLLRAQGIPARVAAGFYTSELIDRKNNIYLVRVNNAHAWTEVYAPFTDPDTGETLMLWRRLDATPAGLSAEIAKKSAGWNLELLFEKMWLGILRLSAQIESMDKDQLKMFMILGLIGVMGFINRKSIFIAIVKWLKEKSVAHKVQYKAPDDLRKIYRRYETVLKVNFGETRLLADTDSDVIQRIREKVPSDPLLIKRIEDFVKEFHAVRFGKKSAEKLDVLLDQLRLPAQK